MSVSIAVSNSPGFSPSSSMFCNKPSIISPAPEALTLTLAHLKSSQVSSSCSSSPSSPSSPFRIRFPKPPSGLSVAAAVASTSSPSSSSASSNAILKRKRPARLDIPLMPLSFGAPVAPSPSSFREVVEAERDGYYSVYCKRGRRRISMEDRYSASVDLRRDSKEVIILEISILGSRV